MSANEPRPLLDALRAGTPLPAFPAEAVEAARALARDVRAATPAAVEPLPEALAAAVLEAAVLEGVPALPEALSDSKVKPLAKAAKKALYRLRSRGVAVAEAPRPAAPEAPRAAPVSEALPAMASTITSAGERALVMARPLKGGGVEMVQALVTEAEGVVELRVGEKSRGSFRRILKEALERGGAVELPLHEAATLLAEAAGTNLRSRTPFPPDLDLALRHFGVQPQVEPTALPPPEPEDVRRVLAGDSLHATPEMATWLPPEPEVKRLLQKLDEVMHSPLALSDVQRQEQLQAAVRTMARDFFTTPESRQRYALRLWRMADYFERTARPSEAEVARGEARRLFHGAEEPFSRFVERLFEKVLALVAAAGARAGAQGAAATQPPGTTSEAPAAAATPSQERRSPGGLILP
ncbi:hypothetical protein JY651_24495 [Pyxidicoccus parkwayensis]|uniref:Uncharacterized protein n=1 Tax=Pyxidicoccus parkwayensis TaxID=2813578 RepID=A0ABX7PBK9_9BACT|nr:hypothetical protein [Pyxidicoccus parkwaysis]QSQ27866.1 hypothetical protein JY651_24495 [Pyxidicoccus parkwaysis]